MTNDRDDINAKIDEYHLMIEEVLGGMDMMISRLESRVASLEKDLCKKTKESRCLDTNQFETLTEDLAKLKLEITEGFNLAFRKIAEK
jgi:hypothetical protein